MWKAAVAKPPDGNARQPDETQSEEKSNKPNEKPSKKRTAAATPPTGNAKQPNETQPKEKSNTLDEKPPTEETRRPIKRPAAQVPVLTPAPTNRSRTGRPLPMPRFGDLGL